VLDEGSGRESAEIGRWWVEVRWDCLRGLWALGELFSRQATAPTSVRSHQAASRGVTHEMVRSVA